VEHVALLAIALEEVLNDDNERLSNSTDHGSQVDET
tara:strand:+ start:28 stop:135 length:108 start_codon:yes stop_codon:yes gene_type:complete